MVSQTLFKRRDTKGRVAALEILIATPAVRNLIRDGKTFQIPTVLQTGKKEVGIARIEPVGNYAIQLYFTDGHDTGIYSWTLLYEYGMKQEEMWRQYLERMAAAGASREPQKP